MIRVLYILLFFSLSSIVYVSSDVRALEAVLDMTSSGFRIPVEMLNPVGGGNNVPGGIGAIKEVLRNIANILLFLLPILGGVLIILAGYYYIFSWGDSERTSTAKKILKYNLIALTVGFLSYSLVNIIASFF